MSMSDNAMVAIIVVASLVVCVLCLGEPDIIDGIVYRLYDGKLPTVQQPKE